MSTGDSPIARKWLPTDRDAANGAEPDTAGPVDGSAGSDGSADAANGAREAEEALERFNESAERAKKALQASQGRGEQVDEQVRAAAAGKAMQAVKDAEASAREAAEVAERMAEKVAEQSERLADRERELTQLREQATEQQADHERELKQLREQATEQEADHERELKQLREQATKKQADHEGELAELREEIKRATAEPVPDEEPVQAAVEAPAPAEPVPEPEPEPATDAEPGNRHRPREPAHRRQQTEAAALDLNTVGFDELCAIGFSVKQAARLIGHREQRGGFESPEDLDGLSGMPEKPIEALKNAAGG